MLLPDPGRIPNAAGWVAAVAGWEQRDVVSIERASNSPLAAPQPGRTRIFPDLHHTLLRPVFRLRGNLNIFSGIPEKVFLRNPLEPSHLTQNPSLSLPQMGRFNVGIRQRLALAGRCLEQRSLSAAAGRSTPPKSREFDRRNSTWTWTSSLRSLAGDKETRINLWSAPRCASTSLMCGPCLNLQCLPSARSFLCVVVTGNPFVEDGAEAAAPRRVPINASETARVLVVVGRHT